MPELEEVIEFLSASAVFLIIVLIISFAWISTYVREQPLIATAVVVFQQETSHSQPSSSVEPSNTNTSNTEVAEERSVTMQSPDNNASQIHDCHHRETEENISSSSLLEVKPMTDNEQQLDNKKDRPNLDDSIPDNENMETAGINTNEIYLDESINENTEQSSAIANVEEVSSASVPLQKTTLESSERDESKIHSAVENIIDNIATDDSTPGTDNANIEGEVNFDELSSGSIRIKLKFLDDSHRLVRSQLSEEVGNFKRANFSLELSSNHVVRLIFNGQLLNRDHSTLAQYGLFDNCVVHCHVSQPQTSNASSDSLSQENDGLDISELLAPLLLVVVAFLWYLRYEYSHIFSTSATIILVCLTLLLLVSQYALTISFNISFGYDSSSGAAAGPPNIRLRHGSSATTTPTAAIVPVTGVARGGENVAGAAGVDASPSAGQETPALEEVTSTADSCNVANRPIPRHRSVLLQDAAPPPIDQVHSTDALLLNS